MSLTKKILTGIVMGLLLGGASATFINSEIITPKVTKSTTHSKMPWLPAQKRLMQGKAHQSLQVQIHNLNDLPTSPDEPLQLEIRLSSSRQLDQAAQYRWTLPDGVRLVDGESGVNEVEIPSGETIVLHATITGVSLEMPQLLRFDLIGRSQGEPLAAQGFFASHPTQIDLSRRPLRSHQRSDLFEKANTATETTPRLPAGIQF